MPISRCSPSRCASPGIAPPLPRILPPISARRRPASTSRRRPRSAWASSGAAKGLPRAPRCCSRFCDVKRARGARPYGTSGAQQYVDGAAAAVDGARAGECHDITEAAQPGVDRDLENRPTRARSVALAVNDPEAAVSGSAMERDELGEAVARLALTE